MRNNTTLPIKEATLSCRLTADERERFAALAYEREKRPSDLLRELVRRFLRRSAG